MAYKLAVLVALAAAATLSVDFTSSQTVYGSPYVTQLFHESTGSSQFFATPEPDTSKVWNHSITSTCSTGIWIYYEHVNYNTWYFGNACYTVGIDSCSEDIFKQFEASSFRYAGSPTSFDEHGITLYDDTFFHGTAFYGSEDSYNYLNRAVVSYVVTGSSNWTLYEESNFGSPLYCVVPRILATRGYETLYGSMNTDIEGRSVKSVKKGCDPMAVIRSMEPLAVSHQVENAATGTFMLPKQ